MISSFQRFTLRSKLSCLIVKINLLDVPVGTYSFDVHSSELFIHVIFFLYTVYRTTEGMVSTQAQKLKVQTRIFYIRKATLCFTPHEQHLILCIPQHLTHSSSSLSLLLLLLSPCCPNTFKGSK